MIKVYSYTCVNYCRVLKFIMNTVHICTMTTYLYNMLIFDLCRLYTDILHHTLYQSGNNEELLKVALITNNPI